MAGTAAISRAGLCRNHPSTLSNQTHLCCDHLVLCSRRSPKKHHLVSSSHSSARSSDPGQATRIQRLLFSFPLQWFDKMCPKYLDFKHRTTKGARWINNRFGPHWVQASLATMAQVENKNNPAAQQLQRLVCFCFSPCIVFLLASSRRPAMLESEEREVNWWTCCPEPLQHSSTRRRQLDAAKYFICCGFWHAGQTVRMQQLLQAFFSDSSLWWNKRFDKKNPKHLDYNHNSTNWTLWIESWSKLPGGEAKIATMVQGRVHSGGGMRLWGDSFGTGGNVSKLSQEGRLKEALQIVDLMVQQGIPASINTYACLLKGCIRMKALAEGKRVHALIIKNGFESDIFLGNNLVHMYAKCGSVLDARQVFDKMTKHNVFSWTAIISAYAKQEQGEEAVDLFQKMQQAGVVPDRVVYVFVLKACASMAALERGKQVHAHIIKSDLESDIFVGNSLVDMYVKCMSIKDARQVFNKMCERDVVSWNAMIAGYVQQGHAKEALTLFEQMQREGTKPNNVTFLSILKACASLAALEWGKQIHAHIIKSGFESNVFVGSTLIDMYGKCGSIDDARQVFNKMHERDVVSWNAMIAGYSKQGLGNEALSLFEQMQQEGAKPNNITFVSILKACASLVALERGKQVHAHVIRSGCESDVFVGNTLVDMYAKCGSIEDARQVFNKMREHNVVSWNAMISGYSQQGLGKEALTLFEQMQQAGAKPDNLTFVSILKACSSLAALERGKQVHAHIIRSGFESDVFVGNTLVDMYAKCGSIKDARQVFNKMHERDVVSWNAMIAGYAQQGLGKEALTLFEQMQRIGMKPDGVTFSCVLAACSHGGLVDEGRLHFNSMRQDHGIMPAAEHYVCMVDLLGRAGRLEEAEDFINKMPIQPNAVVWLALLGACRSHGNVELGRRAFLCALKVEPKSAAAHVLLSNIYAAAGMWDEVAKIRKAMKDTGMKKERGCSWIEVDGKVHTFLVADRTHPQSKEIQAELKRLTGVMKEAGYVPDLSFVLHDRGDVQREDALCDHSEKLAIGFGLICTRPGAPIRIKKNLRACGDCHSATKFISKIVGREIIVRDTNRFHHFKDGVCSCGDYW